MINIKPNKTPAVESSYHPRQFKQLNFFKIYNCANEHTHTQTKGKVMTTKKKSSQIHCLNEHRQIMLKEAVNHIKSKHITAWKRPPRRAHMTQIKSKHKVFSTNLKWSLPLPVWTLNIEFVIAVCHRDHSSLKISGSLIFNQLFFFTELGFGSGFQLFHKCH